MHLKFKALNSSVTTHAMNRDMTENVNCSKEVQLSNDTFFTNGIHEIEGSKIRETSSSVVQIRLLQYKKVNKSQLFEDNRHNHGRFLSMLNHDHFKSQRFYILHCNIHLHKVQVHGSCQVNKSISI